MTIATITPPEANPKAPAKAWADMSAEERESLYEFLRSLGDFEELIKRMKASIAA
jgi:hypothetical protein